MTRASRRATQSITIDTVAQAAGVSSMTVSNVLNNRPNVRSSTRDIVLKAVAELGYTPNAAARSLASAATTRIGLISGNLESGFLSSLFSGTIEETSNLAVQLIMRRMALYELADIVDTMEQLARSGVGAVLSHPPFCETLGRSGITLPIPMVAICPGDELPNMPSVRIDDRAAAREMTAYLISLGHKRIGFVRLGRNVMADRTRYEGYCAALAEAGLSLDESLVAQSHVSFTSGLAPAEQLLSLPQRPTAIFAANDELAAAVISVAHRMGIDIPRDVSLAGFDDGPLAIKIWPTLTTIRQPVAAIAAEATRRAVAIAIAIAQNPSQPVVAETTYFDYSLVARESTAPCPL